jgi:glycine betaine/proline transport system ATP-binding protein
VILKDGAVVQQGEPQHILLNPNDDYIIDFIADINRARVLRVRSIMEVTDKPGSNVAGDVDPMQNLESVIAMSGGDTNLNYRVVEDGQQIGLLHMRDLVRALVPVEASDPARRAASAA